MRKDAVTSRAIKANAVKGADADTLDGKDSTAFGLRCPAGTLPKWGACLEVVLDPAAAGGGDLIGISQGGAVFNVAQNATNVRYRCVLSRVNG